MTSALMSMTPSDSARALARATSPCSVASILTQPVLSLRQLSKTRASFLVNGYNFDEPFSRLLKPGSIAATARGRGCRGRCRLFPASEVGLHCGLPVP